MPISTYRWLMAGRIAGDPFDRHLFACAIAVALADPARPLAVELGLSAECLSALVGRYFPHAPGLLAGLSACDDGTPALTEGESDLRALLLAERSGDDIETDWLAHILARRTLSPHHLWQDLGLTGRADLGLLMHRHFAPLATRNRANMRWKRFLSRELRQDCPSPICQSCADFASCFDAEDGRSMLSAPVLFPA